MSYNKQLAGLRFFAIFLVLFSHFFWWLSIKTSSAFYGVDLFFTISGFLITSNLLSAKEPFRGAYRNFIGRRTLRIFPIYYLVILLLFVIGNEHVHNRLLYLLTYSYNYAIVQHNLPADELGHLWSLSVEEQFYLFWPIVVLSCRRHTTTLKTISAAIILLCSAQILFEVFPSAVPYKYHGLFPRALALVTGALGAVWYKEGILPIKLLESKCLEAFAFVLFAFVLINKKDSDYIIAPLVSLYLIYKTYHKGFSFSVVDKFLRHRWIVYIGTISYGIYLYHNFIRFYFGEKFFLPQLWERIPFHSLGLLGKLQFNQIWITFPLYSILSIILAHLSYRYVETPILELKDKWFPYGKEKKSRRKESALEIIHTAEHV